GRCGAGALEVMAAIAGIARVDAPRLACPEDAGAADPAAGVEGAELTHRQRAGVRVRAPRPRLLADVEHHLEPRRVLQLVVVVLEVGRRPAGVAALERQDVVALRGELLSEDARGPAGTDRDELDLGVGPHGRCSTISSTPATTRGGPSDSPGCERGRCSNPCGGRRVPSVRSSTAVQAPAAPGQPARLPPAYSP